MAACLGSQAAHERTMKPIVLTPGMGVGPEVTARALALQPSWRPILLAGRANVVRPALEAEGLAGLGEHEPAPAPGREALGHLERRRGRRLRRLLAVVLVLERR